MRDQTDSRTLPLSLGKPRRQRTQQSGAAFLPPLSPAAQQEREFQQERVARRGPCTAWACETECAMPGDCFGGLDLA